MGRHHQSGGAGSTGSGPRRAAGAVRWLSQPGSGEALASWGTVFIIIGGLLGMATAWGYLLIMIGLIVGALGLDLAA